MNFQKKIELLVYFPQKKSEKEILFMTKNILALPELLTSTFSLFFTLNGYNWSNNVSHIMI